MYAWWVLIQNWGTLRFSDHRGIDPSSVVITKAGFSAILSRSKTIGTDKSIGSRPLTIAACCYISVPTWMQEGFTLLQQPSPATDLSGAITKEMRYETGYGLQNRVLLQLNVDEERLHIPGTTQFWTPHSGRAFLPSATALRQTETSWVATGASRRGPIGGG